MINLFSNIAMTQVYRMLNLMAPKKGRMCGGPGFEIIGNVAYRKKWYMCVYNPIMHAFFCSAMIGARLTI